MYVTNSHTMLVTTVVVSAVFANKTGPLPENGAANRSQIVTSNAVVIAEISLQALIRHQYQRSRYTPPVPAPTSRTYSHPERIEAKLAATSAEQMTSRTVASRDTTT